MTGISRDQIEAAVRSGLVEQRPVDSQRWLPSLLRDSVERWAADVRREQLAATRKLQRRERHRARASAAQQPPNDGHVWINRDAAAAVLNLTPARVGQLTRAARLPHVRRGRRVYYRRDLVEQIAAARAARARGSIGFWPPG